MKENTNKGRFCSKAAFALIEWLVVVLIIGILAEVAVPQYRIAVMKSRMIKYIVTLKEIVKAEDIYYLDNGQYTRNLSELDIEVPEYYDFHQSGWFSAYNTDTYRVPKLEIYFDKDAKEEPHYRKIICWPNHRPLFQKACQNLSGLSEPNVNDKGYILDNF